MTVTQGKWSVRKVQDKDNFWFGRWVATSPWRVDRYSKARDFAVRNTWQEALDHANEMANRSDMSNGDSPEPIPDPQNCRHVELVAIGDTEDGMCCACGVVMSTEEWDGKR